MKRHLNYLVLIAIVLFLSSCMVTNNLYVNDPYPVGKGESVGYAGIGTGFKPDIDSVKENGDIVFNNELILAPNLCIGGQIGVGKQIDLRVALHFPYIIGGFGARVGAQYGLFPKTSKFNAAIGTDIGFVIGKDTLFIGDSGSDTELAAKRNFSADIFLPLAIGFNESYRIIITPRYSFNSMSIRNNTNRKDTWNYTPSYFALSLGVRLSKFYLEASAIFGEEELYPNFGIVYMFGPKKEKSEMK